jgi:hypothetical protein
MNRIAIVGAGAIGVRHLQGLAALSRPLDVHVVDPSEKSWARAAALLLEAGGLKVGKVRYHADPSDIPIVDLAIVATNARERAGIVSDLVQRGVRCFILEKVLFPRLAEYDHIESLFAQNKVSAWVNCVRRAYPRANLLLDLIGGRPFTYSVDGQGWGLACNVIHHLDEVAMLSGASDIHLENEGLAPQTISAKRPGYIEFLGNLGGTVGKNSRFSATCLSGAPADRIVTIACNALQLRISQTGQTLSIKNDMGERIESFPIPLQSEATADHVTHILDGRAPALPNYSTAAKLHRVMIGTFLDHLRQTTGNPDLDECPIT